VREGVDVPDGRRIHVGAQAIRLRLRSREGPNCVEIRWHKVRMIIESAKFSPTTVQLTGYRPGDIVADSEKDGLHFICTKVIDQIVGDH
jgi:hypothetical protein